MRLGEGRDEAVHFVSEEYIESVASSVARRRVLNFRGSVRSKDAWPIVRGGVQRIKLLRSLMFFGAWNGTTTVRHVRGS